MSDTDAADLGNWWKAPGYAYAWRRMLDLLELLHRPHDAARDSGGWWVWHAALGNPANNAARMTDEQITDLLGHERESERALVTEFIDLHRALLEDIWDDSNRLSDDRVPHMAGLLLKIFSTVQFPALDEQIGRSASEANRMSDHWPRPDDRLFGQLWLADLRDAAWTLYRAYHAAMHRR